MNLLSVHHPGRRLILVEHSAPFRLRLLWLQVIAGAALLVLLGWVLASRLHPAYLLVAGLLLIVLLVLAARASEMQHASERDGVFRFDKDRDAIVKNGRPIASL